MTEWGVVGVIVVLIGLVSAVIAPIIRLTSTIATLTTIVDKLCVTVEENKLDNRSSHDKLWTRSREQDGTINDHESRISILEHKP